MLQHLFLIFGTFTQYLNLLKNIPFLSALPKIDNATGHIILTIAGVISNKSFEIFILYSIAFAFTIIVFVGAKVKQKPQKMVFPVAQIALLISSINIILFA